MFQGAEKLKKLLCKIMKSHSPAPSNKRRVIEKCSFQGRSRIDSAAEMELLTYKYKCYEATESRAVTGFAGL